jgi:glutamate formiminotransferase/formiminotetrahydrofolate cyclodeaminase
MISDGNPNSLSDAGVAVLAVHAAIEGAWMNVLINGTGFPSDERIKKIIQEGKSLKEWSDGEKNALLEEVYRHL